MVKPEFVIDTMQRLDYRYFTIHDANYNLIFEQFQPVTLEEAIARFENCLKHTSPLTMYRVDIYDTNAKRKTGEPSGTPFSYQIVIEEAPKPAPVEEPMPMPIQQQPQPQGFQGIHVPMQNIFTQGGMMGGVGLDQYLNEKNTILELRLRIQQLEMENKYLQDKMERRESELRAEMDRAMSSETRIQGIINNVLPTFMAGFAGSGQAPMNGISQTTSDMQQETKIQNEKQQVINAVNRLMQLDPNFAKNIASLAVLAEKKPDVYAMAVKYLNQL